MSWTLIESQTLGSAVASVTLGSGGTLPQTYKTLKLVVSARSTNSGTGWTSAPISFNGSSANTSSRFVYGTGSSAASSLNSTADSWINAGASTANTFSNAEYTFPNYTGSSYKTVSIDGVTENNTTEALTILAADLWSQTAAITSLTLTAASTNFAVGCTFTLYGLK